jgi:hypothetical protein
VLRCVRKISKSDYYLPHTYLSTGPSVRTQGTTRLPLELFSFNFIFPRFSKIRQENLYCCTVHSEDSLIIKTNKRTNMYCIYFKTHIKTLKKLLHVSIYRSSLCTTCISTICCHTSLTKCFTDHFNILTYFSKELRVLPDDDR